MLSRIQKTLKLIEVIPGVPAHLRESAERLVSQQFFIQLDSNSSLEGRLADDFDALVDEVRQFCLINGLDREMCSLNATTIVKITSVRQQRPLAPPADLPTTCACGNVFVSDGQQLADTCEKCGRTVERLDRQVQRTPIRIAEAPSTDKEIQTLHKMLQILQGEIADDALAETLLVDWPRIETQFKIQHPSPTSMRIEHVRSILRTLQLRKYCKIAPYLFKRYTGRDTIIFTKDELEYIKMRYREVLRIWKQHAIPGTTNLPNCSMIIFEIVEVSGWLRPRITLIQANIHQLESETVARFRDVFWRNIAEKSKGGSHEFRYKY